MAKNSTYQNILLDNVQQLSDSILDKTKTISVRIPDIQISREDALEIRKKILDITPEQWKMLGIKSPLSDIKRKTS